MKIKNTFKSIFERIFLFLGIYVKWFIEEPESQFAQAIEITGKTGQIRISPTQVKIGTRAKMHRDMIDYRVKAACRELFPANCENWDDPLVKTILAELRIQKENEYKNQYKPLSCAGN